MKKSVFIFTALILFLIPSLCLAEMDRYVQVEITEQGEQLHADLVGNFLMFPGLLCFDTLYPVPPDACNISVYLDFDPYSWNWSGLEYETVVLPQQPYWPMIEWSYCCFDVCPFTINFYVYYDYPLINDNGEFIFFYANDTDDLFTADSFYITFPEAYEVKGVWSNNAPIDYNVVDNHLTFDNGFKIIVILKKSCGYILAGDRNDDCRVDFLDHAILAQLMTGEIDFQQVAVLSQNWLIDCFIEPSNPGCVPK